MLSFLESSKLQNCISAGNVVFKFKLDYLITQHQGYINKDSDELFFSPKFLTKILLSVEYNKLLNNLPNK